MSKQIQNYTLDERKNEVNGSNNEINQSDILLIFFSQGSRVQKRKFSDQLENERPLTLLHIALGFNKIDFLYNCPRFSFEAISVLVKHFVSPKYIIIFPNFMCGYDKPDLSLRRNEKLNPVQKSASSDIPYMVKFHEDAY